MLKSKTMITMAMMLFVIAFKIEAGSVPQLINYQGFIKTSQPLTTIKLEFNIYDAATGGTKIWGPQIFNNVSVVQGQFNVILGSTDSTGKSIADAFSSDQRFISLKIDGAGEVLPRQQILSVGYSIKAKHAEMADKAALADNALNANHAGNADHAKKADHATVADRASNSDYASNSDHARKADHSTNSDRASNANYADNANNACGPVRMEVNDCRKDYYTKQFTACNFRVCNLCGCGEWNPGGTQMIVANPGY